MKIAQANFLRALRREPVERLPIWIMRQAGRYLPEYRAVREQVSGFMELCQTPELACEVTLQPLRRYDLDASIVFSDILTVPHALGMPLDFIPGRGPVFADPIRSQQDCARLNSEDLTVRLDYVAQTIRLLKPQLSVPLIGFAGSPWTVATYMVEGGSSKAFSVIKAMRYAAPDLLHHILQILSRASAQYLSMQIDAGADVAMIFDTWGGVLDQESYQTFSLAYMQDIITELRKQHPTVPIILFTKNGGRYLSEMVKTGATALGLDAQACARSARSEVGDQVALQGNLEPSVLAADESVIRSEVARVREAFGSAPGHIFNLGHGITPDIDPEKVSILIDAVHA